MVHFDLRINDVKIAQVRINRINSLPRWLGSRCPADSSPDTGAIRV
jgi:hypothetical protein